jgi:xanthine dehydrogenase accessory factor
MTESLLPLLDERMHGSPVVMASVIATRGATPRGAGSRMLIWNDGSAGSIGGGMAEGRVLAAAVELLRQERERCELSIDLSGRPGAAGICGGQMQLALRRWAGPADQQRAEELAQRLANGQAVTLDALELGCSDPDFPAQRIEPNDRLLIIGGGHCGQALYELAQPLDFDLALYDERPDYAHPTRYPAAKLWSGDIERIAHALQTDRRVLAILLSRDYQTDIAALRVLTRAVRASASPVPTLQSPAFIGMLGSSRRIASVRAALADTDPELDFDRIHAPIGLPIKAHTPHEIAISILAQLIAFRHKANRD